MNYLEEEKTRREGLKQSKKSYRDFILDVKNEVDSRIPKYITEALLEIIVNAYDNKDVPLPELDPDIHLYRMLNNLCKKQQPVMEETVKGKEKVKRAFKKSYNLSDETIEIAILELREKENIGSEEVYSFLLNNKQIPEDRNQKKSLGIRMGKFLLKMHEEGEYFESMTTGKPHQYKFKKEIVEIPNTDLSDLSNKDLSDIINRSLPDIFTEQQVYAVTGNKIDRSRLTNILSQDYLVRNTNGNGPLIFSRKDRKKKKDRSEKEIFIVGANKERYEELKKLLEFFGVASFTHIAYEDIKSPTSIPDSIANAKYIIYIVSVGSHKIPQIIRRKNKKAKFLTVDSLTTLNIYLSRDKNYFFKY